jgi:hypothetical protein
MTSQARIGVWHLNRRVGVRDWGLGVSENGRRKSSGTNILRARRPDGSLWGMHGLNPGRLRPYELRCPARPLRDIDK